MLIQITKGVYIEEDDLYTPIGKSNSTEIYGDVKQLKPFVILANDPNVRYASTLSEMKAEKWISHGYLRTEEYIIVNSTRFYKYKKEAT